MDKSWLPTAAGVLDIVAGIMALLGFVILGFAGTLIANLPGGDADEFPLPYVAVFLGCLAVAALLVGALAIAGGVCALRRKSWGWALAGAIAAAFCSPPLGVPAIILTALADEPMRGPTTSG